MNNLKKIYFEIKEYITDYSIEKERFLRKHGYELNLENPRSFSEKIIYKKIYDRNPILPIISDKYKMRDYVKKILGEDVGAQLLVPLLHVTDDPATIPFDSLPVEYIIKANHGSGMNIIKRREDDIDIPEIIRKCNEWLKTDFGFYLHEWCYSQIERKIIIEKLLTDASGSIPYDYKWHVFDGKCRLCQVEVDKFGVHKRSFFDEEWNYLNIKWSERERGPILEKPRTFQWMKEIAEKVSGNLNFVRVDLYQIGDKVYIGELTNYPGAGYQRFVPQSFDFELGKYFNIYK